MLEKPRLHYWSYKCVLIYLLSLSSYWRKRRDVSCFSTALKTQFIAKRKQNMRNFILLKEALTVNLYNQENKKKHETVTVTELHWSSPTHTWSPGCFHTRTRTRTLARTLRYKKSDCLGWNCVILNCLNKWPTGFILFLKGPDAMASVPVLMILENIQLKSAFYFRPQLINTQKLVAALNPDIKSFFWELGGALSSFNILIN